MIGEGTQSGDDDRATGVLRRVYAGPTGAAYWQELESRIMARIAEVDLGWWTELDRWRRPALIAAAALLVAAGVTMYRARQADAIGAYQELTTPADAEGAPDEVVPRSPRATTLGSVLIARD